MTNRGRWRAGRRERSSRISAGTSSSPRSATCCPWASAAANQSFYPGNCPDLPGPERVWTYGTGNALRSRGTLPPPLIKGRYGEPILTRIYNNTAGRPRRQNGGFGRNEHQLHFHNAHNGAESDGAANVHHFPGTFYDYRWSTTLARRDKINTGATDQDGLGARTATAASINGAPATSASMQGTMWAHDHRFFFTAENVYKGNAHAW